MMIWFFFLYYLDVYMSFIEYRMTPYFLSFYIHSFFWPFAFLATIFGHFTSKSLVKDHHHHRFLFNDFFLVVWWPYEQKKTKQAKIVTFVCLSLSSIKNWPYHQHHHGRAIDFFFKTKTFFFTSSSTVKFFIHNFFFLDKCAEHTHEYTNFRKSICLVCVWNK